MWENVCIDNILQNNQSPLTSVPFPKMAVLVSGSGTNLQAIIDDKIPLELVISDRPEAKALSRAQNANIKNVFVDRKEYKGRREEFTAKVVEHLKEKNIDLVIFAGFMTILSDELIEAFKNRVLNIHPSLLPAFTGTYGKGTMKATLEAGVKITGTTVHIVTAEVDAGPILAQGEVPVLDGDDEDTLQQRIQKVEHILYPQTIRQFCKDIFDKKV
jgi:formyltetrahydrofolate-dependent phosphoribosylglycinamide formyltransferase